MFKSKRFKKKKCNESELTFYLVNDKIVGKDFHQKETAHNRQRRERAEKGPFQVKRKTAHLIARTFPVFFQFRHNKKREIRKITKENLKKP